MSPAELRRKPDHMLRTMRRFLQYDATDSKLKTQRREKCVNLIEDIDAELARRAKKRESSCSA